MANICSPVQGHFHSLCEKLQDSRICGGCIKDAGIFDSEIFLKGWIHSKKCRANVTIFWEVKKCIGLCRLYYLQEHWEPSKNKPWFVENFWCRKKRPSKKFRLLYEWVEDEIDARKSILVREVREHAGLLLGEESGKYKNLRSSVSG